MNSSRTKSNQRTSHRVPSSLHILETFLEVSKRHLKECEEKTKRAQAGVKEAEERLNNYRKENRL